MPKETGRTPKLTGRTWGDWRGKRSGGWTGPAPLRGGWEGGGVPTPGGTLRGSDQEGACAAFPLPNRQGKSARLSSWVLHPQRSPLGWDGPGGIGWRLGRSGKAGRRGPTGPKEQERNKGVSPAHLSPGSLLGSKMSLPPSETTSGRHAWAPSVLLCLSSSPHTPQGLFQPCGP